MDVFHHLGSGIPPMALYKANVRIKHVYNLSSTMPKAQYLNGNF